MTWLGNVSVGPPGRSGRRWNRPTLMILSYMTMAPDIVTLTQNADGILITNSQRSVIACDKEPRSGPKT